MSLLLLPLRRVAYALGAVAQPPCVPAATRAPLVSPLAELAATAQTAAPAAPLAFIQTPVPLRSS